MGASGDETILSSVYVTFTFIILYMHFIYSCSEKYDLSQYIHKIFFWTFELNATDNASNTTLKIFI